MKMILLVSLVACGAAVAVGCSSGGTADGCFDYETFAPQAVTLTNDVMPIFQASCALSTSCHGVANASAPGNPTSKLYLGPPTGEAFTSTEIDLVYAALVGKKADRAPAMVLVAPGNPRGSFLLGKLEYPLATDCDAVTCGPLGCGLSMPQGAFPLDDAPLAVVRSWVVNGAPK